MWAFLVVLLAQTTLPAMQPGDFITWDYADKWLAGGAVTRFRLAIDAAPPVDVPLTARVTGTDQYRYALPTLVEGDHVAVIVACGPFSFCSAPSTFAFTVGPVLPTPVANPRVTRAGGD
jgi:hypothetical protein